MTEKQATWRPTTAKKPPHLSVTISPEQRAQALTAALKGATVAFSSTPTTTPSESPSVRGDPGHGYIASNTYWTGKNEEVKALHRNGSRRTSPSRGRFLSPQDATAGRTTRELLSPAIAARVASTNTSPIRKGVSKSPRRGLPQEAANGEPHQLQPQITPSAAWPRQASTVSSSDVETGGPGSRKQPNYGSVLAPSHAKAVLVPLKPKVHTQLQRTNTGTRVMDAKTRQDTIERMADAMVASSLASRRPISPAKAQSGRVHVSRRRSASVQDIYRLRSRPEELKPPPGKAPRPLKTTLRKHSSENSNEEFEPQKRGRRHLVRKHPHKHREGDRKRWRDKITESERRRYEGVFAANRGRLLESADSIASPTRLLDLNSDSNMVVNVIVRDIWERSRLPSHTLCEIYDLVAPDGPHKLNREQFVVGLWLIDQALKGRKLPARVSDHVWASVRHTQGIKYKPHKPIT